MMIELIRFSPSMCSEVAYKFIIMCDIISTNATFISFLSCEYSHMCYQSSILRDGFVTMFALKQFLPSVCSDVTFKI